ncbi:MAG: hypothetical protein OES38_20125, partial [Gammaproteobacteria bacterium]|nr:hypothetical protein [Gammaproteobacteria bacterium]
MNVNVCLRLTLLMALAMPALSCLHATAATIDPGYDETAVESHVSAAVGGLIDQDTDAFVAILDVEHLLDRVLDGVEMRDQTRQQFRVGVVAQEQAIAANLATVFASAESVTHLRTRSDVGYVSVLYRLDFGDNGLNYHEYLYDTRDSQVFDWYDYALGRNTSESMRSVAMSMLGPQSLTSFFSTLFDDTESHTQRLTDMAAATREKAFATTVELFREAPDAFKALDPALTFLIIAATNADNEADYEYALNQVARYGGDNPRYAFILLDYYLLRGDFDKSIEAANVLQKRLGMIDSGIEELKAGIYLTEGDRGKAIEQFEISTQVEPYRDAAYASLFEL